MEDILNIFGEISDDEIFNEQKKIPEESLETPIIKKRKIKTVPPLKLIKSPHGNYQTESSFKHNNKKQNKREIIQCDTTKKRDKKEKEKSENPQSNKHKCKNKKEKYESLQNPENKKEKSEIPFDNVEIKSKIPKAQFSIVENQVLQTSTNSDGTQTTKTFCHRCRTFIIPKEHTQKKCALISHTQKLKNYHKNQQEIKTHSTEEMPFIRHYEKMKPQTSTRNDLFPHPPKRISPLLCMPCCEKSTQTEEKFFKQAPMKYFLIPIDFE